MSFNSLLKRTTGDDESGVDTNKLSQVLNVPKPSSNQDLVLLPDFKLALLPTDG